jgi:hypothetical protein
MPRTKIEQTDQRKQSGHDGVRADGPPDHVPRIPAPAAQLSPIQLPSQVLALIVSRLRDLKSATYDADAEFVYARVMRGIGSVSKDWRRVATEMLMTDELAWLVQDASAMAACVPAFPHARSLRVTGRIKRNGRQEDFVPLLGSKSIVRLELMDNAEMESCDTSQLRDVMVSHGLLEASISGHSAALPLIRNHMNWFNYNDELPLFLPPDPPGVFVVPDDIQPPHQLYLPYQGIIPHTAIAQTSVGLKRDVEIVAQLYQDDWWLRDLQSRNATALWHRKYPHNYEVTAFEA